MIALSRKTWKFGEKFLRFFLEKRLLMFTLADFGRNQHSSDSLRGNQIFLRVNNARFRRFLVGQIFRHLNTTTSISEAVKTFRTEYWFGSLEVNSGDM